MLLSIIVPVYGVEKYINECLDTLLSQDVPSEEYEIICIDDGSPDDCGKIIDEYVDKYSNVIAVHKENGGLSSARNAGIPHIKGDYVWFVDSDDFVCENTFKGLFEAIKEKNYPDILSFKALEVDDGADTSAYRNGKIEDDGLSELHKDWLWTWLIKTDVLLKSKVLFNEKVLFVEDDVFQTLLYQSVKRQEYYDCVIYYYRQRAGSILHKPMTLKVVDRKIESFGEVFRLVNEYDFFEYHRETVYNQVVQIIDYLMKQPKSVRKTYVEKLKAAGLFPLPKYETEKSKKRSKSGKSELRSKSYTKIGYLKLRLYYLIKG